MLKVIALLFGGILFFPQYLDPTFGKLATRDLAGHNLGGIFGSTDPAASVLTTGGVQYSLPLLGPCTVSGYAIEVYPSGTATVKFWKKNSSGNALPTSSDSISTSGVSISSGTVIDSATTSDFTTTASSTGDIWAVTLTAVGGSPTWIAAGAKCK